jgi:hypothetical protein
MSLLIGILLFALPSLSQAQIVIQPTPISAGGVIPNAIYPDSICLDSTNQDTCLVRDGAADTLALRRGTNAQTFNVYNTYTSATNYERGFVGWGGNIFAVGTAKGSGGGTARNMSFYTDGTARWTIDTSGNLICATDGACTIGASGATRPDNVYVKTDGHFGTSIGVGIAASNSAGVITTASGGELRFGSRTHIHSGGADGLLQIINNAGTDFTGLILGTNDASGIRLVKNGTELQIKLGNSSLFAQLTSLTNTSTSKYQLGANGTMFVSATAPTVSSGFGSSPTIPTNNGTVAFTINVGTGGTASSGVISLPTATTGWKVNCTDLTTPGTNLTKQTAVSTTTATITNYNSTTGVAAAWTASDILYCDAIAF